MTGCTVRAEPLVPPTGCMLMTSWLGVSAVNVTTAPLILLKAVALPPVGVSVAVMASVPALVLLTVTVQVDAPAVIVQLEDERLLPFSGEVKRMV